LKGWEILGIMRKEDKRNESFEGRWGEDENAYPKEIFDLLWKAVRIDALEWIDKNCPKAWYRPIFENE
jgi:hypothetical protein